MKALLVRVGADQSKSGGSWNGPVDMQNRRFVYVPIPESYAVHPGLNKPFSLLVSELATLNCALPVQLHMQNMHLDPDFSRLTYGDQGRRGAQITNTLTRGDLLVFYAGLRDIRGARNLVYALIGLYVIDFIEKARDVYHGDRDCNAHTRRILSQNADDIVVYATPGISGRFERCIDIGEYRNRAYRVRPPLLDTWGGLSVHDGYLQRSGTLPGFLDAPRFYAWLLTQDVRILKRNN